jgi:Putative serine esterase (DUF676)
MKNWKSTTLGGMQFWTDYRWNSGCRLQKNAVTGHWRVLDAGNVRHGWGTRDECMPIFSKLVAETVGEVQFEHVVILMHGLMRTPRSMKSLSNALAAKKQWTLIAPNYASTRASIADHAAAFRELVEAIPGQPSIDIIGHSLGNIVVRHAIGDWQRDNDPQGIVERMKHMVMLGPPNQGATIARRLAKTGLFGTIAGKGGLELGRDWEELQQSLAVPPFPFAIVAGKLDATYISNPLVDGDSDFVVSVEETHLDGAKVEIVVPTIHSFLMDDPSVQEFVASFLQS